MKLSKRAKWIAGSAMAVVATCLVAFYFNQFHRVQSPAYQRSSTTPAKALVVVYSRTGNTLRVAKEAAAHLDADLVEIAAPEYPLTFAGQFRAGEHAGEVRTTTPIKHEPVDLSRYSLVVLCTPTWWFRPAVPMWSFVEASDFSDTRVLLIMTGNSRLKDKRTDPIGALIEDRGGRYLGKHFIRRGRWYWQRSAEDLKTELLRILDERLIP